MWKDSLTLSADGRETLEYLLMYDQIIYIGSLKRQPSRQDYDEDAQPLFQAVNMFRQEMALCTSTFNGQFENGCQIKSVLWALMILLRQFFTYHALKLHGMLTQAALTISQIFLFLFLQTVLQANWKHSETLDQQSVSIAPVCVVI